MALPEKRRQIYYVSPYHSSCIWRVWASLFLRLHDHTQGHITVGRTPLDEWSARRRDLYLTNTQHSKQTNIHAPGGIRTRNPSTRSSADSRLRLLGHWDRPRLTLLQPFFPNRTQHENTWSDYKVRPQAYVCFTGLIYMCLHVHLTRYKSALLLTQSRVSGDQKYSYETCDISDFHLGADGLFTLVRARDVRWQLLDPWIWNPYVVPKPRWPATNLRHVTSEERMPQL